MFRTPLFISVKEWVSKSISSFTTLVLIFQGLILSSFICIPTQANSQDSTSYYDESYADSLSYDPHLEKTFDTLTVKHRPIDSAALENLKKDKALDYSEAPTVGESLWERFWSWFVEFIGRLFRDAVTTNWGRVLVYAGGIAVLVMIIMALLKVDSFKVLFKGAEAPSTSGVFHENIHVMDFESLIKEATGKSDYRNAVRLIFLYSLKLLSEKHHIHWEPGKTNHDYLEELENSKLKTGLGELSHYFDYSWYGGFTVSSTQFERVRNIFGIWKENLK